MKQYSMDTDTGKCADLHFNLIQTDIKFQQTGKSGKQPTVCCQNTPCLNLFLELILFTIKLVGHHYCIVLYI